MVDWAMGKFTYTIDQDTIHKRYEQHISTTTVILELTKIDNKLTPIVLKHTPFQIIPVIFLYFCSKRSERIFVLKNIRALSIIVYLIVANCLLHTLFP